MDIGTIVIHLTHGVPAVVRAESGPAEGIRLVPATNTAALTSEARRVLEAQGVALADDGLYPCPVHLQEAAHFAPLDLPHDLITLAAARDILYPDLHPKTGWARVHQDVAKGRLRAYRVGLGMRAKRFVSRAEVRQRATQVHAAAVDG